MASCTGPDLRALVERCIWEWEQSGLGSIETCDEIDEQLLADRLRREAKAVQRRAPQR